MGRNRTELGWGSCSHRAKTGRRGSRAVGRRIWADEEAGRLAWRWASRSGEGDTGQRAKQGDERSRQRRGQHESLASELLLVTEEQRQQPVPDDALGAGEQGRQGSPARRRRTEGVEPGAKEGPI